MLKLKKYCPHRKKYFKHKQNVDRKLVFKKLGNNEIKTLIIDILFF